MSIVTQAMQLCLISCFSCARRTNYYVYVYTYIHVQCFIQSCNPGGGGGGSPEGG
jgi:hypothetical protein